MAGGGGEGQGRNQHLGGDLGIDWQVSMSVLPTELKQICLKLRVCHLGVRT